MEKIKGYKVSEIMEIINKKRIDYINKYNEYPNVIEINKRLLTFIKLNYLSIMNHPLEEIKILLGMNVKINEYIDEPEEIKVYYKDN